jgi:hypothetical protein
MTYTNEIEVEVDFSDVDPNLLEQSKDSDEPISILSATPNEDPKVNKLLSNDSGSEKPNLKLGDDEPKPTIAGRAARFFRKKN